MSHSLFGSLSCPSIHRLCRCGDGRFLRPFLSLSVGRRGVWSLLTWPSSLLNYRCCVVGRGSFKVALHRSGLLLAHSASSSLSSVQQWLAGLGAEAGPMQGALGPVSAERLRARGSQPCCLQLRVSELLAQDPKGRDIYGLITGLLILIYLPPVGLTQEVKAKGLCL